MTTDDCDMFGDYRESLGDLDLPELLRLAEREPPALQYLVLGEVDERSSTAALALARRLVRSVDDPLRSPALEIIARRSAHEAHQLMVDLVDTAGPWTWSSIVELLAVDLPIAPGVHDELLARVARRLRHPAGSRDWNLADLFFRQYPHLR